MQYIDQTIEEIRSKPREWHPSVKKGNIKVWVANKGSNRHKTHPYIRFQLELDSKFSIHQCMKAFYDLKHRMEWDKSSLQNIEIIPTDHPNVQLVYTLCTSKFNFKPKEFLDKRCLFSSEDAGYAYIT